MQNLTKEDIKLVVESLLFTGTVQVFSEHNDEECKRMVELAKKLNEGSTAELDGIYFLAETEYEEPYVADIPVQTISYKRADSNI